MRRNSMLWLAVLAIEILVIPEFSNRVLAQAPTTVAEAKEVILVMAQSARLIDTLEKDRDAINAQINSQQQRVKAHNANRCVGTAAQCAEYNRRAQALDEEGRVLVSQRTAKLGEIGNARNRFNLQLSRMRIAPFLGALQAWRDRVVACAALASMIAAAACLEREWQQHP